MTVFIADHKLQINILLAFIGTLGTGLSIGILRYANLGTDPYTILVSGLAGLLGSVYSQFYVIMTAALLLVTFFLDKHYIGLATILNLFIIGKVSQTVLELLSLAGTPAVFGYRLIILIFGLLLMGLFSSMYYNADLGVSGYDAMALISSDKLPFSFKSCRITTDVTCIMIGLICGEMIGIGTLVLAFGFGPITSMFNSFYK